MNDVEITRMEPIDSAKLFCDIMDDFPWIQYGITFETIERNEKNQFNNRQ